MITAIGLFARISQFFTGLFVYIWTGISRLISSLTPILTTTETVPKNDISTTSTQYTTPTELIPDLKAACQYLKITELRTLSLPAFATIVDNAKKEAQRTNQMLTRLTQAHKTKMHLRLIKHAANLICDSNETGFTRNDLRLHNIASTNLVTQPTSSHNLTTQDNKEEITSSTKETGTKSAKKGSLDDQITQALRKSMGIEEDMRLVRLSCGIATKSDLQPLPKPTETSWEAAARVGYEYFGIQKEDQEKITPEDLAKTIGAALESNPQDKIEIEKAMGYISASKLAAKDDQWVLEFAAAYQKELKRIETAKTPTNEAAASEENTANTTAPNMM